MQFVSHLDDPAHVACTHWKRWERDLAGPVEAFHKEGFVHGDLTDGNFIIPTEG